MLVACNITQAFVSHYSTIDIGARLSAYIFEIAFRRNVSTAAEKFSNGPSRMFLQKFIASSYNRTVSPKHILCRESFILRWIRGTIFKVREMRYM